MYDNRAPKGGLWGEELGGKGKLMRSKGREPKEEGRGGGGEKEREGQGGSSLLALLRAEQKPLVTTHQPLPPNPPLMYVQPLPCILKFNVIYFIVRSCSEVSIGMGTPLL